MLTLALQYLLYIHYEVMKCDIYDDRGSGFAAFTIDLTLYSDKIYFTFSYTYVYPKFRPV